MSSHPSSARAWMMYALAAFFYMYEFLLRVTPSPMFSVLMQDFNIDAAYLGYLSSFYFISYALLQVPAGMMVDKFGPRKVLTVAVLLCCLSTLVFAWTTIFFWVCVARLFIGAGSAFAFVCCVKIITLYFEKRWFASLTGLTLMIGSAGAILGLSLVGKILVFWPWRTLMNVLGISGILLAVAVWYGLEEMPARESAIAQSMGLWDGLKQITQRLENWKTALYGLLTTAPSDALGGLWAVPFFVQVHHFSRAQASDLAALVFVGVALGSFAIGPLSEALKSRKKPMMLFALASLGFLMMTLYGALDSLRASIGMLGFGFFGVYVLAFTVARDQNEKSHVGTVVGFVNMMSMLGSTFLQSAIGQGLAWCGALAIQEGTPVYAVTSYQSVLAMVPLCYLIAVMVIIPWMKESYPK